jgi:hypothetical protein
VEAKPPTLSSDFAVLQFPQFLAIVGAEAKVLPPLTIPEIAELYAKTEMTPTLSAPGFHVRTVRVVRYGPLA